ncbi:MAG: dihydroorotase [Rhodobacteraceae bacterium TMED160]|nr:MAG: dihydroorotase [Rhodobacteraceae bacterium TMED160]
MKTLLTNAKVIDPLTETISDGEVMFEDGIIIPKETADETIDCQGQYVSPGLIDLGVKVGEPGERHKESYKSAGASAAAGGVTTIVTRPDTIPAIDTPEVLEFIRRRAQEVCPVNVFHMVALTKERAGREMTEIGFLKDAGAIAFTDFNNVVKNSKILSRALSYAKSLDALVIGHPQDPDLSEESSATSGKFASLRGLPSVTPLAERMALDRDMALVELTGVQYHFDQITTARSIPALERAKRNGHKVTAGTSIHHLTLNELDVADYRSFFKLNPPLRSENDRMAIIDAVNSGVIDIVSSFHTPQDEESKRLPFETAAAGAVGLETLLPASLQLFHSQSVSLGKLIRTMTLNPAILLNLPSGRITPGAPADLIIFDADTPFILDRETLKSKSKNTPYDGQKLQGKVRRTIVSGKTIFEC